MRCRKFLSLYGANSVLRIEGAGAKAPAGDPVADLARADPLQRIAEDACHALHPGVEPARLDDIRLEIAAHYMGAGEVFVEYVSQVKVAKT